MADRMKECEHAIFNEIWGEYKCAYRRINISGQIGALNYCVGCTHYQKRKGELKTCKTKE